MQPRSRSAQERYNQHPQRTLRFHLDSLNPNIPSLPSFPCYPNQQVQQRMHAPRPNICSLLRESIPMAESKEYVSMAKMKTAIDQLQALMTSNQNSPTKIDQLGQAYRRPKDDSLPYQRLSKQKQLDLHEEESVEEVNRRIMLYYKLENERLKQQLKGQLAKNLDNAIQIRKLESLNSQLEHEMGILLRKCQTYQPWVGKEERIKQLQHQVKQQVIINLQLQQLLLNRKMKEKDLNQNQKQSDNLKQMKLELFEAKNKHKRQIQSYTKAINQKNEQIIELQQALKLMEKKEFCAPFTFTKIQQPIDSPPPLESLPHSQKPYLLNFTSTNPSLQQAQIRKKSDFSVTSKEYNCLNLGNLSMRNNKNRAVSKTDRP